MKSGLMALAIAMIELKENDALPHGTIKFMATAGEERNNLVPHNCIRKVI